MIEYQWLKCRLKEWIGSGLGVDRSAKEEQWEYMKKIKVLGMTVFFYYLWSCRWSRGGRASRASRCWPESGRWPSGRGSRRRRRCRPCCATPTATRPRGCWTSRAWCAPGRPARRWPPPAAGSGWGATARRWRSRPPADCPPDTSALGPTSIAPAPTKYYLVLTVQPREPRPSSSLVSWFCEGRLNR